MVGVSFMPLLAGGTPLSAFSLSYLANGVTSATTATQSVASISFGAAPTGADTRYIVVAVHAFTDGNALSSVTIGGVAATQVVSITDNTGSNQILTALWIAAVPTGTSGSISLTFAGATVNATRLGTYRMINPSSATAHATASDDTATSGLIDLSLNVPSGGGVIAASLQRNGDLNTWVGATENYDTDVGTGEVISSASGTTSGTPLTLTDQSADSSPDDMCGVAASWAA